MDEVHEERPVWLEGIIAMELPVVCAFWGNVPDGRARDSSAKPLFPDDLPV